MKTVEVPFANQEGRSTIEQNSREVLINMFAEIETGGRKRLVRKQRVGLRNVLLKQGDKRCIEVNRGIHYCIIDDTLYSYSGELKELGKIGSKTGRCTMVFNENDQILISDGQAGYFYDGFTVQPVDTPVAMGPVAYQGGFGIFSVPETGQFYITPVNDFSAINPLDFATAEGSTDKITRVFVDHNEVWLFGERSAEIWQLSGGLDFPFSRASNITTERGCLAPYSVCAEDNTVFWLGHDGLFYKAVSYSPTVISTPSVADIVEGVPPEVRKKADAFVYTSGVNKFYTVSFPGYATLQYNIRTGFWNVARTFGKDTWNLLGSAGHTVDFYLTLNGIAVLDSSLNQDEFNRMERGGVSPPVEFNGERTSVRRYFLDAEVGRADMGKKADVMMRFALDGETFQNEIWRSLGPTGDYRRRAIWRNLGRGRKLTAEFFFTDDVEFSIMDAQMVVE